MEFYEGEKYYCNIDQISNTLKKYGVAIVPNLLNDNECNEIINGMWDYLEHITKKGKYKRVCIRV